MESRDLRVGNYLLYNDRVVIVDEILFEGINLTHEGAEYEYRDLKPIELSEEILLKCGFVPCSIIENNFNIKGMCIWKCNDMFLCDKNGVHIKHLHQLQNLYWCLTNKELNVQL